MKKALSKISQALSFQVSLPVFTVIIIIILSVLLTINIAQKRPEIFGLVKGIHILQKEEEELIRQVGELISLPEGEKPSVATVTDEEKLGDQVFFNNAKEGDKVFIYTNAKKVILYRPSENRVVEVGSVNIQEEVESESTEVQNRFVLLNGTQTTGLTNTMESDLTKIVPEAVIVSKANAVSLDYEKSLLVNLGASSDQAEQLADDLGIELVALPEGEKRPEDVDFLIIVGSDRAPESEPEEEPAS
jgi:hypothetical protein